MNRFAPACFLALSLLAVSCSSSNGDLDDAAPLSTTSTTASAPTTTEAPENLAFADVGPLTLRVSVPTLDFVRPDELDETNAVEVFVTDLLTDGLTVVDPSTGVAEPGVASSWSTSPDGLEWTFKLGDSTFGDGTVITADDVVWSLLGVANRGVESISGPNLWAIDGWEDAANSDIDEEPSEENGFVGVESFGFVDGLTAVDDKTVVITLTERFEPLPEVLAGVTFGIWPRENSESEVPVSSSIDFTPTALWADGLRLELEDEIDGEVSTIELFVDSGNTLVASGETDLAIAVDPDEPLGDLRGVTVQRSADAFFAMNANRAPFDDPMIRQAIVLAIDTDAIRSEYFPNAGPMQSFIPQHILGGVPDACGEKCEQDLEQAQTLVDASPSRDVAFTVDYFAEEGGDDLEQRLAESIASDLRAIGLVATARSHTTADFGTRAALGELGLFRFGSVSTAPTAEADIGAMFHTAGRDNLTGTSIERFDSLIDEARKESDPSARANFYESAEQVLFGEAVVLPLVEFRHHLAHGPTLTAAGLEADGSLDLSQIEFAPPSE